MSESSGHRVDLLDLIAFYYEHYPSGGWLHIALDDGNLEDRDIWFCQEETERHEDWLGRFIADRLREMTYQERDRCYKEKWFHMGRS